MRLDLGENGSAVPCGKRRGACAPPPVDQERRPSAPQAAVAGLIDSADASLVEDLRHAGRDDGGVDYPDHVGGQPPQPLADRQDRLGRDRGLGVNPEHEFDFGRNCLKDCVTADLLCVGIHLSPEREPSQVIENGLDSTLGIVDKLPFARLP